ncbi:MAG: PilZ domain-containing protein [gamma proteobacterium symbiont of Bathyaustriella thionipta]|nr:PilZ domain-containing protein [gamma proteobacterium symbiont of Bathyaustriella thionipta]MCU7950812.1 PilZ domain-containing protein [gamma proteobacterium symbiont of Bathyaustriella thionipta]MCU7953372.1 PilZ domain-containing protein [gamma proteobacterium symbiont of Bathyaustriella thionipta]MCU7957324.1 PilZ domain-containing protein [gamma proteobacterium symbiont of Bathyaustriella thionipta]MCU7967819.1 PilZ domain-containing protein [gamma proteobacterium symbiont of Bathyaustr
MSFFDFLTPKTFHKERAQEVMEKLLKDEFIYQLKQDSSLTVLSPSGKKFISNAVTLDRKRNSLIIAEKSPEGRLILERNDPVTLVTQANTNHEVYSFNSRVSNIILDNSDILYEVMIPKRILKGQRRKDYRINIDSSSKVKINHSVYEGQVSNISTRGVLFALDGYWPEPIEEDNGLVQCDIDMNFMAFNCNIEVRYINFEPYPGRRTYIGGQIKNLQPLFQHQLDNFLTAQQRIEQRKKAELRFS